MIVMALGGTDWRHISEETWGGPMNMALDEVAAATAASNGLRTTRVYRWNPTTVSLGYNQDSSTINWEFCERIGVDVTRRPTGGGGIYHDSYGDISYSIITPAEDLPSDLLSSYKLLCEPILETFRKLGIDAKFADEEQSPLYRPACYLRGLHPAHDVVVDGRKISGNAQYRRKDVVIQHGSLKYDRRPTRHLEVFDNPDIDEDLFLDRVTSIREVAGVSRQDAVGMLERTLEEWKAKSMNEWKTNEITTARDHSNTKFNTNVWIRNGKDPLE